jgi:hypothetical protein
MHSGEVVFNFRFAGGINAWAEQSRWADVV